MEEKWIWFDSDGTLFGLYDVDDWLNCLLNSDATPYLIAPPLVNMSLFARYIHQLQGLGYKVGIVSWLSKNSSELYDTDVTIAKMKCFKRHLPSVTWDAIHIIPYGTPKHEARSGILFDDELPNRTAWNKQGENFHAYDETVIFDVLKQLIAGGAL